MIAIINFSYTWHCDEKDVLPQQETDKTVKKVCQVLHINTTMNKHWYSEARCTLDAFCCGVASFQLHAVIRIYNVTRSSLCHHPIFLHSDPWSLLPLKALLDALFSCWIFLTLHFCCYICCGWVGICWRVQSCRYFAWGNGSWEDNENRFMNNLARVNNNLFNFHAHNDINVSTANASLNKDSKYLQQTIGSMKVVSRPSIGSFMSIDISNNLWCSSWTAGCFGIIFWICIVWGIVCWRMGLLIPLDASAS